MIETALVVLGTRPEAIKLAPVVHALRIAGVQVVVVSTDQQQEQLAQAFASMELRADYNLGIPPGQALATFVGVATTALAEIIRRLRPQVVVVQGDTSSALAGALAAFYEGVAVAHVEAGLRTRDLESPFPEEANRQMIARLARLHFAPTERAARHLESERCSGHVFVTGNTGIDALHWKARQLGLVRAPDVGRPTVLVTMHRRENIGEALEDVCGAVRELAQHRDVCVVWPVHRNPRVRAVVEARMAGVENVKLRDPLDFDDMVRMLHRARLVLTDSGGLQEEAPAVGVPVLVLRDSTERPEAIEAGVAKLIGTRRAWIVQNALELLDSEEAWAAMAKGSSPFGDGHAAGRIAEVFRTGGLAVPFR